VRARVDADAADPWRGINQVNAVLSQGIPGLGGSENGSVLLSRANGRVDFTKFEVTVTRVQPLFENLSMMVAAYTQVTRTPLLAPELCGYGGRAFGRAYDPSAMVGDRCVLLLGELRLDAPHHHVPNLTQMQFYGFVDRGWLHNLAANPGTPESVDGASVGGGLRLGLPQNVTVDLSTAKGIVGLREAWRFFFITTGRF